MKESQIYYNNKSKSITYRNMLDILTVCIAKDPNVWIATATEEWIDLVCAHAIVETRVASTLIYVCTKRCSNENKKKWKNINVTLDLFFSFGKVREI